MSAADSARRVMAQISFAGKDITADITPFLSAMTYTDQEENETDELQIDLNDRNGTWLGGWLDAASSGNGVCDIAISAVIVRKNWNGDGKDDVLDCGTFELADVDYSGAPNTLSLKATALPYSAEIQQTEKSKAWESYNLSGIASEMAGKNGMSCMYLATGDPFYQRVEQYKCTDIKFLQHLCHEAGISLKATNKMLVLFDQSDYEGKSGVLTIKRGGGNYEGNPKLHIGKADVQYKSCTVSYVDPASGKCISGTYTDSKAGGKQTLKVTAKVSSATEAKELAQKCLRLHNKSERTAEFTLPGNTGLVAGLTVNLEDWGVWSGKYIIKTAVHKLGTGYKTKITLRRVLEGY